MIPAVLTHCVGIDIGKRALADPVLRSPALARNGLNPINEDA